MRTRKNKRREALLHRVVLSLVSVGYFRRLPDVSRLGGDYPTWTVESNGPAVALEMSARLTALAALNPGSNLEEVRTFQAKAQTHLKLLDSIPARVVSRYLFQV